MAETTGEPEKAEKPEKPDEGPRPLNLESRGESATSEPRPDLDAQTLPPALILERWAIVARRFKANYLGYEMNEDTRYEQVRSLLERRQPSTRQRPWDALMNRLRSRKREGGDPLSER